jgi:hypothetical protein
MLLVVANYGTACKSLGSSTDTQCDESAGFSYQVIGLAAGWRADLKVLGVP